MKLSPSSGNIILSDLDDEKSCTEDINMRSLGDGQGAVTYASDQRDSESLDDDVSFMNPEEVTQTPWDEVYGLEKQKEELRSILCDHISFPQLKKPTGLLLYGCPGTGKTHLLRAIVTEKIFSVINVKAKDVIKKYFGEGSRSLSKIFQKAKERTNTIIFFDEIDCIASQRDSGEGAMNRLVNALLVELSGLQKTSALFFCATNFPDRLDNAFLDRISHRIYIPSPGSLARKMYFAKELSTQSLTDDKLQTLAKDTDECNFRDLSKISQQILTEAVRLAKTASHFEVNTGAILLDKYRPCFCSSPSHGIRMSYADRRGQIQLPAIPFEGIQKIVKSYNRNDDSGIKSGIEKFETFQGDQIYTRNEECTAKTPRKCCPSPRKLFTILIGLPSFIVLISAMLWYLFIRTA